MTLHLLANPVLGLMAASGRRGRILASGAWQAGCIVGRLAARIRARAASAATSLDVPVLLSAYTTLFAAPGVPRFTALAFLARLPIGTLGLATLLHVQALTGSIAFAGSVVGAQMVATAAMAPVFGRIIDRRGPYGVLAVTALVAPAAILLVYFAGPLDLTRASILVAAIATGAFTPPIPTLVRTLWRYRFEDESRRRTAYAIDSVGIELTFTLGPALVGWLVAVATPRAAHLLAFLFTLCAVPLLVASGGLRWWKAPVTVARDLLGPLRTRKLLVLYATTFALAVSFGTIEVGYPGFAGAIDIAAWGPALIAVCSVGSALGGLAYGAMHLSRPVERQIPLSVGLLAVPLALHLFTINPWGLAVLAFLAGLMIAPSLTGATLLVSRYAPSIYVTEAFTWSQTAIVTGVGCGMALGGALIERFGPNGAFALATVAALLSVTFALGLARR